MIATSPSSSSSCTPPPLLSPSAISVSSFSSFSSSSSSSTSSTPSYSESPMDNNHLENDNPNNIPLPNILISPSNSDNLKNHKRSLNSETETENANSFPSSSSSASSKKVKCSQSAMSSVSSSMFSFTPSSSPSSSSFTISASTTPSCSPNGSPMMETHTLGNNHTNVNDNLMDNMMNKNHSSSPSSSPSLLQNPMEGGQGQEVMNDAKRSTVPSSTDNNPLISATANPTHLEPDADADGDVDDNDAAIDVVGLSHTPRRLSRRRHLDEIPRRERWRCPNTGCGREYKRTSSTSIGIHKDMCHHRPVLVLRANDLTNLNLLAANIQRTQTPIMNINMNMTQNHHHPHFPQQPQYHQNGNHQMANGHSHPPFPSFPPGSFPMNMNMMSMNPMHHMSHMSMNNGMSMPMNMNMNNMFNMGMPMGMNQNHSMNGQQTSLSPSQSGGNAQMNHSLSVPIPRPHSIPLSSPTLPSPPSSSLPPPVPHTNNNSNVTINGAAMSYLLSNFPNINANQISALSQQLNNNQNNIQNVSMSGGMPMQHRSPPHHSQQFVSTHIETHQPPSSLSTNVSSPHLSSSFPTPIHPISLHSPPSNSLSSSPSPSAFSSSPSIPTDILKNLPISLNSHGFVSGRNPMGFPSQQGSGSFQHANMNMSNHFVPPHPMANTMNPMIHSNNNYNNDNNNSAHSTVQMQV